MLHLVVSVTGLRINNQIIADRRSTRLSMLLWQLRIYFAKQLHRFLAKPILRFTNLSAAFKSGRSVIFLTETAKAQRKEIPTFRVVWSYADHLLKIGYGLFVSLQLPGNLSSRKQCGNICRILLESSLYITQRYSGLF